MPSKYTPQGYKLDTPGTVDRVILRRLIMQPPGIYP